MALSRTEARALALRELETLLDADLRDEVIILDEFTMEKPYGWVFFYNTREFVRSGNPFVGLAGNAPLIVNSSTSEVRPTGTAEPLENYLAAYERSLGLLGQVP